MKQNVSYQVKDWFANKLANQLGVRFTESCKVFAIIKETEKAVYAMLTVGQFKSRCSWVPKSVLEEYEVSEDEVTGAYHHETLFEDYETAKEDFNYFWQQFA